MVDTLFESIHAIGNRAAIAFRTVPSTSRGAQRSAGNLAHEAGGVVVERLRQLSLRVHHEWTAHSDWFSDWLTAEQQHFEGSTGSGSHGHAVTFVEDDELADADGAGIGSGEALSLEHIGESVELGIPRNVEARP